MAESELAKEGSMATSEKTLRVLVVDDNRDGADAMGLLVEELGNQVHVTYGGTQALDVANAFRPDLMLVDLVMPEMDGCGLVTRLRQIAAFAQTRIVAITGEKGPEHKSSAMKAGFDTVLFKPVSRTEIEAVLASVVPGVAQWPRQANKRGPTRVGRPLPIDEARRIRHERKSKTLTQEECEAAICDGIIRFQEEYLGWRSERIEAHLINDLLVVRLQGVLTLAERQLSKSASTGRGRDLIKAVRTQLLETARPMLESLVHEVAGIKVMSLHHDISTVTGEEVVIFSLADVPHFQ
jgi:CheY-like chemotaxis protein